MTYKMAVGRFAALMREQMRANSHKQGWQDLDAETCWKRTMEEMAELGFSIGRCNDPKQIKAEIADVANFLMMLMLAVERGE